MRVPFWRTMFTTAVIVTALAGLVARDGGDSPVGPNPLDVVASLATSAMDEASGGSPHGDASGAIIGIAQELLGEVRDDKRSGRRSDPGGAVELIGDVAPGRRIAVRAGVHRPASVPATLQSAGVRLQI